MKRTGFAVLLLLLCPLWAALGQQSGKISVQGGEHTQPPQPFTNESIAGLVKIGFSDETIVSMIEHQPGNYSLRAEDVNALKKAGVSEKVIAAMSKKMGVVPPPATQVAAPVATQSAASTGQLTNDGIVKLAKAGLGEDTIVSMVNTQPGTYSVSADDIIALKKAGVPEKVIRAMLNKPVAPPTPPRETPTGAAAEQGQASQTPPMPSVPADTASSASSNARKP